MSASEVKIIGASREEDAVAKMIVSRREWERSWYLETTKLKSREPSITEPMKQAKIMPRGRSGDVGFGTPVILWDAAALRAGVQKKTKRYMEPSKKQEARPRVKIRLSVMMVLSTLFAGGIERESDAGVGSWSWLSP